MGHSKPAIKEITLRNVLSFGPDTPPLHLERLNVLIGPNGSGKSNLIDVLNLLHHAPTRLATPIRTSGGITEWLWKRDRSLAASCDLVIENPQGNQPLRHVIEFLERGRRFELSDESVENQEAYSGKEEPFFYYRFQRGKPVLSVIVDDAAKNRELRREEVSPDESILSQRKDPDQYPQLTYLGEFYGSIRIYRDWSMGRDAPPRLPQKTDESAHHLAKDCRNLGLVLNRFTGQPEIKRRVLELLQQLYDGIQDFGIEIEAGTAQLFVVESAFSMPATRLSDGTLRYLCLLAILCDPDPPPVVCIEEPELGLHPDILPGLAELMIEASKRTQLFVTTHSDILVDCFTDHPEYVVVCEKHEGQTQMERLDSDRLKVWLEKYRLGDLWMRGEIGGTRW